MTDTVYDVLSGMNNGWTRHDGTFGVEIETEALEHYRYPTLGFWDVVGDGSLRNAGAEYITRVPLTFDQLDEALAEFNTVPGMIGQKFIEDSISTSVHVHYNALNLTPVTLANALTVYAILEPVLCKFAGPYRESNLFCLQLKDAEASLDHILTIINYLQFCGDTGRGGISTNNAKYAALNMSSFWRFGSVEFRAMRGVTDTRVIRQWCEIIHSIFEYSATKLNPIDVMEDFQGQSAGMLNTIFGATNAKALYYQTWQDDADKNLWYAWKIASSITDWDKFGKRDLPYLSRQAYQAMLKKLSKKLAIPETNTNLKLHALAKLSSANGLAGMTEGVHFQWRDDEDPQPLGRYALERDDVDVMNW